MAASGLCILCSGVEFPPGSGNITEPDHCYGHGDTLRPGLLGGFVCSCDCRRWGRPEYQAPQPPPPDVREFVASLVRNRADEDRMALARADSVLAGLACEGYELVLRRREASDRVASPEARPDRDAPPATISDSPTASAARPIGPEGTVPPSPAPTDSHRPGRPGHDHPQPTEQPPPGGGNQ